MINWRLFSDNKLIINQQGVSCEVEDANYLKYLENKEISNEIDLINEIYIRETKEFRLEIDVKNNKFRYKLKENNLEIEDNLEMASLEKQDDIILKYKLDEEEKQIIIQML